MKCSRDNPFAADGELSRAADLILASSTFSSRSISVVDPDLQSSSISLPQTFSSNPPSDPITIVSTTTSFVTTSRSGSPRRVSFAATTHAPIHTTTHAITQRKIQRTTEATTSATPHALAQETTHVATSHVSAVDSLTVARADVTSEVVAIATVQHRVLDEVVKVTLDRSQEVTATYVMVRSHVTETSSESDTSTPEDEGKTNNGSEVQLPVQQDEGQGQDITAYSMPCQLQSQGETQCKIEGQAAVYEHCELQGQIYQGHCHDTDAFEWVDVESTHSTEETSLLNDVMSALKEGGFKRNAWMTDDDVGQGRGVSTVTETSKCLETVSEEVARVHPRSGNDPLSKQWELTEATAERGTCGVQAGKPETHETEPLAGIHVSMETVPIDTFIVVKPCMNYNVTEEAIPPLPLESNDKKENDHHHAEVTETEDSEQNRNAEVSAETRLETPTGNPGSLPEVNTDTKRRPDEKKVQRKISDLKLVIEMEKPSTGMVRSEAGQFSFTSLGRRIDSSEPLRSEKDGPVSGIAVQGKGNPTEDLARDTESGDDCDTLECTQRTMSGDGKSPPVKSLKRKLLCCSVH